jgi:transaldolase
MTKTTTLENTLRERIAEERAREQTITAEGVYQRIAAGNIIAAGGTLLYHTQPAAFPGKLKDVLAKVSEFYPNGDAGLQKNILNFLVKLAIDLTTFVPNWALTEGLSGAAIAAAAESVSAVLTGLEQKGGPAPAEVTAAIRSDAIARIKAEGISDAAQVNSLTDQLLGKSLTAYVTNIATEINASNLIEVARATLAGKMETDLGNDYAAFLQYTIWQGASFVTTNPVLIKMAWDVDPAFWNAQVDGLIRSKYAPADIKAILAGPAEGIQSAITAINSLVTMSVVEANCRLLRDIFLISGGQRGYVSLQVNPKNHSDGAAMVTEARALYADLERRFAGVPNVVFKLPATAGGLYAAEKLTEKGIGVNITVNFSVFQELGFGEVLDRGHALVSYLALMNGRMSFPVRDDLKAHDIAGGVDAARWAGVEVARKSYHGLYDPKEKGGLGIDPLRVRLLIASLRIYGDWIPDISELWGCPVITIFPNVRRSWDSHPRELEYYSVLGQTPPADMAIMLKGELFRQAWWMPGDPEKFKPARVLTLDAKDSEDLAKWPPVAQTLGQFIDLYDQMGQLVLGRMKAVAA